MRVSLIIIFLTSMAFACSCGNDSSQKKAYEDSANYYSYKLKSATDSLGLPLNDSLYITVKNRIFIYKTMRQHYIDKMNAGE